MDDYISREAAIRFFNKWADDLDKQIDDSVAYPHLRSDYKVCKTQLLDCIHAIEETPAADVRPVVRGGWKPNPRNPYWLACTVCGYVKSEKMVYNYYPNCGADMRTREEGEDG